MQQTDFPIPILPRIDISRIPELEDLIGLFGISADAAHRHSLDDNRAELLDCLYAFHPGA
ncbi:hypothetical protein WBP06_17780 [Novosphingobium sp. BL-8H]|uniref:hypothetical protein n=1 Tax=Novosphingobium sp. BL-8H TaxID=3127640 RepID=UPI003756852A